MTPLLKQAAELARSDPKAAYELVERVASKVPSQAKVYWEIIYYADALTKPISDHYLSVRDELIGVIRNSASRALLGKYQADYEKRVLGPAADVTDALKKLQEGLNWLANQHPDW